MHIEGRAIYKKSVCVLLNFQISNLDGHFGVLVGQLESVVKHLQVLLQRERGGGQLLLVRLNVLSQPGGGVDEQQLLAALQSRQQSLVVLGVLPHPRVAVIDKHSGHILVSKVREDHKPLGQEVGLETVAWADMSQVHDNLVGLGVVGLQGEQNVVDEKVTIDLARFEPTDVKDRQHRRKARL